MEHRSGTSKTSRFDWPRGIGAVCVLLLIVSVANGRMLPAIVFGLVGVAMLVLVRTRKG